MALRGTATHRKIRRLARYLNIDPCFALGIMEAIWHLTAEQQIDGGIGRLTDLDICEEILYSGDPTHLIETLCREDVALLDRLDNCRLFVHDWHEWADDAVIGKLVSRRERFANGAIPRLTKYSKSVRDAILAEYELGGPSVRTAREAAGCAHDAHDAHGARNAPRAGAPATRAGNPEPEPAAAPVPVPAPDPAPAASGPVLVPAPSHREYPQTAAAVREHYPQTDDEFVMALVQKSAQEALSANGKGKGKVELSDSLIAEAVRVSWTKKQETAGLYMKTVPQTVKTWMVQGKSPPQTPDELKSTYGKLQPVKPRPGDGWGVDERESTTGKH